MSVIINLLPRASSRRSVAGRDPNSRQRNDQPSNLSTATRGLDDVLNTSTIVPAFRSRPPAKDLTHASRRLAEVALPCCPEMDTSPAR